VLILYALNKTKLLASEDGLWADNWCELSSASTRIDRHSHRRHHVPTAKYCEVLLQLPQLHHHDYLWYI